VKDHETVEGATKAYNDAIVLAGEVCNFAIRDVLGKSLVALAITGISGLHCPGRCIRTKEAMTLFRLIE